MAKWNVVAVQCFFDSCCRYNDSMMNLSRTFSDMGKSGVLISKLREAAKKLLNSLKGKFLSKFLSTEILEFQNGCSGARSCETQFSLSVIIVFHN